jgi:hypothetical protein
MSKSKAQQPGKRLYECEECRERRFVAWVELNRAAKPKCLGCGSTRLELVSDDAKEDRQRLQRERVAGSGGSLELSPHLESKRRKVT